jgi:2,3-bisphosphoglycerate-dependent phosphoglycerate mutase
VVGLTRTLHLVRHGTTAWSESGRLCGWSDVPLNDTGRKQARELRLALGPEAFAGIWSSDLSRAAEFAHIAGHPALPDTRLREIDFGELEGLIWSECDPRDQEALVEFDGFQAPGGESVHGLRARVVEFVEGLSEGDHLLFTHGGVIRSLTRLCGAEQRPDPGGVVVLTWEPGR